MQIPIDMPIGAPMTDDVLNSMNKKQRDFWHSFFQEVEKFIDLRKCDEKAEPYNPTRSLQEKYERAIRYYDGSKYCQMKQLESIISFDKIEIYSTN